MSHLPDISAFDIHASVVPEVEVDATKFIATALVVRALRVAGLQHALVGAPCAVGIIGIDPTLGETVADAARDLLKTVGRDRYGFHTVVHNHTSRRERATATAEGLIETLRIGVRLCCIFTDADSVPAAFRAVADGIAVLPPVDAELVRIACIRTVGQAPSQRELATLGGLPLPLLSVGLMKGRSVAQGAALAGRLLAAQVAQQNDRDKAAATAQDVPPGPRLEDLHGLGEAGTWGIALAADLQDYRAGRIGWDDVDRGALVSGPPGTGKTTFALAVGRTCGVPVFVHSFARWQAAGYLNDMLKAMRNAFAEAQAAAPSLLFVDEVDAVGDRMDADKRNANYQRQVINAFLECLDGAEARTGVIVVGATNHPDLIDPAVRRPGRLDRDLRIPLPDTASRVGILRHHLGNDLLGVNLEPVAVRLEGASGAAIERAVRDGRRRARRERRGMLMSDLEASLPPRTRLTDAAFRRACVHEAGHLVVGSVLAEEAGVVPLFAKVSRDVCEAVGGMTEFRRTEGFDRTRNSHLAEIAILLAGRASEELVLGSLGDGSGGMEGSDLNQATEIACNVLVSYGLGTNLGHLATDAPGKAVAAVARDPSIRASLEAMLVECLERARAILRTERFGLDRITETLSATGMAKGIGAIEVSAAASDPRPVKPATASS